MSNIKNTRSYTRFIMYLAHIKEAKSDEDLLMAGHNLLEAWKGYRSQTNSDAGIRAIKQILKEM